MIALAKSYIPFILYTVTWLIVVLALVGRTEGAFALVVFLMPLRNVVDKFHRFPLGHDLLDILLASLFVGTFVRALVNRERAIEKSPVNVIAALLILYTFISLIIGSNYLHEYLFFNTSDPRIQSWKNYCILPLLYFVTLNNIKEPRKVWYTVGLMCLTMIFMDLYVIRQISWFQNLLSRQKIHGTFVYLGPNEVAAFYNMYTVILTGLFFSMRRGLLKLMLLGLLIANSFCILFLFSRAAYLGFVVGLFFVFAVKNKKLMFVLVLSVIFWQMFMPARVQERILMTTGEYGELDKSSALRLVVWEESLNLFQESPLVGVGYDVFRQLGFELGDTHNIFLKILAEQGIIGMVIFLSLLLVFFIQGIKLFKHGMDEPSRGLGLGFAMGIIVTIVNNIFGNRWTYMELGAYLWIFAGLVARLNAISDHNKQKAIGRPRLAP